MLFLEQEIDELVRVKDGYNYGLFSVRYCVGISLLKRLLACRSDYGIFVGNLYLYTIPVNELFDDDLLRQLGTGDNYNLGGFEHCCLDQKGIREYKQRIAQIDSEISSGNLVRFKKIKYIQEKNLLLSELNNSKYNKWNPDPSLKTIIDYVRVSISRALVNIEKESPETAKLIRSNLTISINVKLSLSGA